MGYYIHMGSREEEISKDGKKVIIYRDGLVKVPDQISEEEAEKLIKEKKAFKLGPIESEIIDKQIQWRKKGMTRHQIERKIVKELFKIREEEKRTNK